MDWYVHFLLRTFVSSIAGLHSENISTLAQNIQTGMYPCNVDLAEILKILRKTCFQIS